MRNILFLRRNFFWVLFTAILFLAIALRFYDYNDRYGLAYDQAHDAVVSRYAVSENKIPLLGPFSSAGPFQTGGEWYWLLMIPISIYPYSILSPWIFITILYVIFVACIILLGKEIKGNVFGLFVGALAAVSTAQISQSLNLTNQAPHALIALLAIWAMLRFIKKKKDKYLFFIAFFVSLSISIHLQGVALMIFLLLTIILTGIPSKKGVIVILAGLLIPLSPILIYDIWHDFFNIRNMVNYYLFDQYKISFDVLGRRWLTYVGEFLPQSWSYIIGGLVISGYIQIVSVSLILAYSFLKKRISKEWLIIGISTLFMIGLLRYIRTPLYGSYLVFLHPFIFLLTGYFIITIYNKYKILGILVFIFLFLGSFLRSINDMNGAYNYTRVVSDLLIEKLIHKYPQEKFAIYDQDFEGRDKSLPLVLFLEGKNKISNKGIRVGISIHSVVYPLVAGDRGGYGLYDLTASSSAELQKSRWVFVNPSEIYRNTEEWYSTKK